MDDRPDDAPKPSRRAGVIPPFVGPRRTPAAVPPAALRPGRATPPRHGGLFTPPGALPSVRRTPVPAMDATAAVAEGPPSSAPAGVPLAEAPDASESEIIADADRLAEAAHIVARSPDIAPSPDVETSLATETSTDTEHAAAPEHGIARPLHETPAEEIAALDAALAEHDLVVQRYEPEPIALDATGDQRTPDIQVIAYDEANSALTAAAPEGERPRVDGLEIESTEVEFERMPSSGRLEVENFWATEPFRAPAEHEAAAPDEPASPDEPAAESITSAIDAPPAGLARVDGAAPRTMPSLPDEATIEAALRASVEAWGPVAGMSDGLEASLAPTDAAPASELALDPWFGSADEPTRLDAASACAAALERVAQRVRRGEIALPSEPGVTSDGAALALVLSALLRHRSGRR